MIVPDMLAILLSRPIVRCAAIGKFYQWRIAALAPQGTLD
jgi:hypothetical protein